MDDSNPGAFIITPVIQHDKWSAIVDKLEFIAIEDRIIESILLDPGEGYSVVLRDTRKPVNCFTAMINTNDSILQSLALLPSAPVSVVLSVVVVGDFMP